MTSVTIGKSVASIEYGALNGSAMAHVVCLATTPPNITSSTFSSSAVSTATLQVPLESLEAYQQHTYWKKFGHILPFIGAGPGDIDGDGEINIADVTKLIDKLLSGEELPAYIDVNGDGSVDIADVTKLIDQLLGY